MVATCVFVVIASLLLQPIHRAYAEELAPDTTLPEPSNVAAEEAESAVETVEESVTKPEPEPAALPVDPPPSVSTTGSETGAAEPVSTVPNTEQSTTTVPTIAAPPTQSTSSVDTLDVETDGASTTVQQRASTTTTTSGSSISESSLGTSSSTVATTTPPDANDSAQPTATTTPAASVASSTATSSDDVMPTSATSSTSVAPETEAPVMNKPAAVEDSAAGEETPVADERATASSSEPNTVSVTHTTEQNAHQFAKDDCVLAGNGAYYCTRAETIEQFAETSVFAAPDAGGDTEIFVRVNGEELQLTNDVYDDGSPHYDAISERVVWHSLRGDRYQIVSYDFTTEREILLTDTSYNNMEPVAFGERIAWQAWRGGDWEIMLFDGETTIQLTSNDRNDVAPSLYGDYVMWQAQFADGARLAVYDINTGSTEFIKGSEDIVAAQNPRMVLLYDQVDADGTTATFGFDMESRETIPLGRVPAPLPDRLPSPEEPGSEKALVHAQPTLREGGDERDEAEGTAAGTSSSTEPVLRDTDLLLSATGTSPTVSADEAEVIPDVIVPAATSSMATTSSGRSTAHIPDVVVPPVASSSSTTTKYDA